MKIYVASSWRNPYQPSVVEGLRSQGYDVYDFQNPPNGTGFAWSSIDPNWLNWTPAEWREALQHPLAIKGFRSDFDGMRSADLGVFVAPAGPSACMEIGWLAGHGIATIYLVPKGFKKASGNFPENRSRLDNLEPDLMVKLCSRFLIGPEELYKATAELQKMLREMSQLTLIRETLW